jgi:predicted amidophosphoribosyltransferase
LHTLKFNGMRRLTEHVLGDWMAEGVLRLEAEAAGELVVVPVPLFQARERERGFNQAELLAEAAIGRLRKLRPAWRLVSPPKTLVRVKDTRPMYALGPAQRRRNLEGAFKVARPEVVRGGAERGPMGGPARGWGAYSGWARGRKGDRESEAAGDLSVQRGSRGGAG